MALDEIGGGGERLAEDTVRLELGNEGGQGGGGRVQRGLKFEAIRRDWALSRRDQRQTEESSNPYLRTNNQGKLVKTLSKSNGPSMRALQMCAPASV